MRFRNSPDEIFNRKDGSRTANYIGAHVLKHESATICNGVDYLPVSSVFIKQVGST